MLYRSTSCCVVSGNIAAIVGWISRGSSPCYCIFLLNGFSSVKHTSAIWAWRLVMYRYILGTRTCTAVHSLVSAKIHILHTYSDNISHTCMKGFRTKNQQSLWIGEQVTTVEYCNQFYSLWFSFLCDQITSVFVVRVVNCSQLTSSLVAWIAEKNQSNVERKSLL